MVTGLGLLLQLQPWQTNNTSWVEQHPQIYVFDFLVLQIPGLSVVPSLLFASPIPEVGILIIGIFLAVATWKNWDIDDRQVYFRKLGTYSYFLAIAAIFCRLLLPILMPESETAISNPIDIRNPRVTMAWISFQSTLMLTLVIVHLRVQLDTKSKRIAIKKNKDSPHTRQSPVTLAIFRSWGS